MTLRAALVTLLLLAVGCSSTETRPEPQVWWRAPLDLPQEEVPPGLKVAFFGDQGVTQDSKAVLELVKKEGAQALVILGDFDYLDDPEAWDEQLDDVLGKDFPVFSVAGNHDEKVFYARDGYQDRIGRRLERIGVPWRGEAGLHFVIRWKGLFLLFAAPDVLDNDPEVEAAFLRDELARDGSKWRVCCWHKNQNLMQTGNKPDEAGWDVYEESRRGGAIIATGHEHAYSRSHLFKSCKKQEVASTDATLQLAKDDPATPDDEGRTFVFVSGLGGRSIRDQKRGGSWWAAVSTRDRGAKAGALFGEFHVDGDPGLARFAFKDTTGEVIDQFTVRASR